MSKIKIALPKGSLQKATLELLEKAGYQFLLSSRSYAPLSDDENLEAMLIRAQEIAKYVEEGVFDAGITGMDWVVETGSDVEIVSDMVYAKQSRKPVRWVLAVPNDSDIKTVQDLEGKRIATEVVQIAKSFLNRHGVNADVEFSWGATEAKCPDLVDAIIEVTETGSSLRANNLRIITDVQESTTKLIANKKSWEDPWKQKKIQDMVTLISGALEAYGKVGLKMNVREENLDTLVKVLPSMKNPTVSALYDKQWVAIETIIEERAVRELIPQLKDAGACDIIEYPLNKVID
jgi:ATP phosphoribosyltransferase